MRSFAQGAGQQKLQLSEQKMLQRLKEAHTAESRIQALLDLTSNYRLNPGSTHLDLIKVLALANEAISLSAATNNKKQFYTASLNKLYILHDAVKVQEMEAMLETSTDSLRAEIARNLSRVYNDYNLVDNKVEKAIGFAEIAKETSRGLGNRQGQIDATNQMAWVYLGAENLNRSEENFLEVTRLADTTKYSNVAFAYKMLVYIYQKKGQLDKAIALGLAGTKYLQRSGETDELFALTQSLSEVYQSKQSIDLLKQDNIIRRDRLEQATFIRNITILFVAILIILIALLYKSYRSTQRATGIISSKNESLENLLREKEWLLKEVHHRVKNNLQTVVSLLESQSVYLNNEALEANQDSRNRIYAMSLVHQKLYLSQNVGSIQMDTYLAELIQPLRDSLDVKDIVIKQQLAPVQLDVSQAIPIGLILNEAVTNSVKHAFPSATDKTVISKRILNIRMELGIDQLLSLTVADNGIGLAPHFDSVEPVGLGIKLIKGLTDDLMGEFSVASSHGTTITVRFLPRELTHAYNDQADILPTAS